MACDSELCASTTTPSGEEPSTSTTEGSDSTTTTTSDDVVVGVSGVDLEGEAARSGTEAVEGLVERLEAVGDPVEVDVMGLEASMNAFAAALVAVGMITAVVVVGVRHWRKAWRIPARYFRYALISTFSVAASLALWEIVSSISGDLVVIPDEVTVEGDLWSGPFAGVTVPLVEVMLDAQPYVVGILIAALPLAGAVAMLSAYDRVVWVTAALVVANIVWLPFVVILVSRSLIETDAAAIAWWSLGACVVAAGTNAIAVAGTQPKEEH